MNLILNLVLPFTSHEDLVPHPIKWWGGGANTGLSLWSCKDGNMSQELNTMPGIILSASAK